MCECIYVVCGVVVVCVGSEGVSVYEVFVCEGWGCMKDVCVCVWCE